MSESERGSVAPTRRIVLGGLAGVAGLLAVGGPRAAHAFGEEGAFHPRVLLTGTAKWEGLRVTAPGRWSKELVSRTSAPARPVPGTVRADEPSLLAEPFAVWGGEHDVAPLTTREVSNLRRFFSLGGVLLVDEFAPDSQAFSKGAKRELARVLPEGSPIAIGTENVVFRSFYRLQRAEGRVAGPEKLEAIIRGGLARVIFTKHDLLGALARSRGGVDAFNVTPGGDYQRERAVRLAVNVAMFVLCANYKDDQVHSQNLIKRGRGADSRGSGPR